MNRPEVDRDERTTAVENASHRLAYLVLTFGVLLSVAYRGLVRHEAAWDLLFLVILAGSIGTAYQARQRVISRRWLSIAGFTALVAAVVAALVANLF